MSAHLPAVIEPQNTGVEMYRASTDAANICRAIVLQTAMEIQRRKYVKVEGWQAIAIAHGCTASARDVEKIEGGYRATGEVVRLHDGRVIAQGEGFVGDDEKMWAGRPVYARRAMAQTRAISRACRAAFAHVVVMMDAGLSTTPAEEVPDGGFDDGEPPPARPTKTIAHHPRPEDTVFAEASAAARGGKAAFEKWWKVDGAIKVGADNNSKRFLMKDRLDELRAIIAENDVPPEQQDEIDRQLDAQALAEQRGLGDEPQAEPEEAVDDAPDLTGCSEEAIEMAGGHARWIAGRPNAAAVNAYIDRSDVAEFIASNPKLAPQIIAARDARLLALSKEG